LCAAVHMGLLVTYPYRLVGPGAWTGARQATLGAQQRLTYPLGPGNTAESVSCNSSDKTTATIAVIAAVSVVLLVIAVVVPAVCY
jgi:hypothetical protein